MSSEKNELNSLLTRLEETALTELDTPDFASSQLSFIRQFGETIVDIDQSFMDRPMPRSDKERQTKTITAIYLQNLTSTVLSHVSIRERGDTEQVLPRIFMLEPTNGLDLLDLSGLLVDSVGTDLFPIVIAANAMFKIARTHEATLFRSPEPSVVNPDTSILIIPEDTEAYAEMIPAGKDFLLRSKKLLGEQGVHLYQKTKHLRLHNESSHVSLSSRSADNSGSYTDFSPLSIQFRDGDITYSFDKNDEGVFDQKIFKGDPRPAPKVGQVNGDSNVFSTNETVGSAEYIDQTSIIAKESTERSLGMYEPTLDITKLVLAALEQARNNS